MGELVPQDRDLRLDLAHPELVFVEEALELVAQLPGLGEGLVQRVVIERDRAHACDATQKAFGSPVRSF